METHRSLINVNSVAVPGVNRNGAFISEAPIPHYIRWYIHNIYRQQLTIDFDCILKEINIIFYQSDWQFMLEVTRPNEAHIQMAWNQNDVFTHASIGNYKSLKLPGLIIPKGTNLKFSSNPTDGFEMLAQIISLSSESGFNPVPES